MTRPLDNTRERNLVPLLLLGLVLTALMIAGAVWVDRRTERMRIANIERTLVARGHGVAVEVRPAPGDNCWRASEGFHWRTAASKGYACAGPRDRVDLYPGADSRPSA